MYAPPHQLSGVLALLSVSLTRGIGASASSAALEGVNDPVAWATEIEAVEPAAAAELLPPFNEDGDEDFDNEEETTSAVGGMAKRVPLKVPNAPDICTDEMKCMNECQRKDWQGQCKRTRVEKDVCKNRLFTGSESVGPDEGLVCTMYMGSDCTGDKEDGFGPPGWAKDWSVDPWRGKFTSAPKSWKCKNVTAT